MYVESVSSVDGGFQTTKRRIRRHPQRNGATQTNGIKGNRIDKRFRGFCQIFQASKVHNLIKRKWTNIILQKPHLSFKVD